MENAKNFKQFGAFLKKKRIFSPQQTRWKRCGQASRFPQVLFFVDRCSLFKEKYFLREKEVFHSFLHSVEIFQTFFHKACKKEKIVV